MRSWLILSAALLTGTPSVLLAAGEASLRGSPAAMREQNRVAREAGLDSYRTPRQVREAAERGELVALEGNAHYELADFVSFPYVNASVALFVERLAEQYHAACGQPLVITSGTRPANQQPSNAHELSVHPMGMAVDLRVSDNASCRSWLERTLLSLEEKGLLNATRERRPPHYHVAIFPAQYLAYADSLIAEEQRAEQEKLALEKLAAASSALVPAEPAAAEKDKAAAGIFLALALVLGSGTLLAPSIRRFLSR